MLITPFQQAISQQIWQEKYRYQQQNIFLDQCISDTWQRVAQHIAAPEKQARYWQQQFFNILENFQFLPGGRILAGAGTEHQVTLLNCFVMDIAEDSLAGIFQALQECALTLQQGGGVGYDFSILRPAGDNTRAGTHASGPVSFMRIWDTTCSIMQSTGARRGAMMGVMRCDHPDIEAFIAAKRDARELRHFNVSVMISDDFMAAVQTDSDWPLVFPCPDGEGEIYRPWGKSGELLPCKIYKRIKARALWESIQRSAYDYAEPGVLFYNTINRLNPLYYCETIHATNPCGEIPLPAYGACDLGAINLSQFVTAPFTEQASFNWHRLEAVVAIATRFLDNVIDAAHFPLPVQQRYAHSTRRIGLGLTGLADALVMLGLKYSNSAGVGFAAQVMEKIRDVTWLTSIELGKEKGCFPLYEKKYLQGEFVQQLPKAIINELAKCGCRNSHHNTIAPAGTISLLANNIANGIEPIFSAQYDRAIRTENGDKRIERVANYSYFNWKKINPTTKFPAAWEDINSLTPEQHLTMQAALQPYIDNAISKTINLPSNFAYENLNNIYFHAFSHGLKGCTIYRPNAITGSVLMQTDSDSCNIDADCDEC